VFNKSHAFLRSSGSPNHSRRHGKFIKVNIYSAQPTVVSRKEIRDEFWNVRLGIWYIYWNFESHWESIFRCFQSNDILFWIFSSQPIKPNYFTMTIYTVSKHILTKWKNTANINWTEKLTLHRQVPRAMWFFYEQVNQILLCESVNQNQTLLLPKLAHAHNLTGTHHQ
jgi:hypothetical protein